MGSFDDDTLYKPGGDGLINFPEQMFWTLQGDEQRADAYRGAALQLKASLDRGNTQGLEMCSATRQYDDGTVIEVQKRYNHYHISIMSPGEKPSRHAKHVVLPELQPGQFYYIPGCIGRYFFGNKDLQNETPPSQGAIPEDMDSANTGEGVQFLSFRNAELPILATSPDGSISRPALACRLDGADPDSGYNGARLSLSAFHIPTNGPFSISCVVRLRQPVQMDYTFTEKTKELDCGYQIYNPVKPRQLFFDTDKGVWWTDCPGSLAPLVGYKIPSRFSNHWVRFTYPWPSHNLDFISNSDKQIGYRSVLQVCENEPLLESVYNSNSPYWDKVPIETLETISGEFLSSWDENIEMDNTDPYESYCTFKVSGDREFGSGTRVVAEHTDGTKRYATVVSYEAGPIEGELPSTVVTLKDYQYKSYIFEAQPSLTFGSQPFPVRYPKGYMIGTNIMGLSWYNGNRVIAGKICDFETEYNIRPIISDPLEIGQWYTVCLTYDDDGMARLYIGKIDEESITSYVKQQSKDEYIRKSELDQYLNIQVAADDWMIAPSETSTDKVSSWVFSSFMDISMLRFYHRALSLDEAVLLRKEVKGNVFVADDNEAAQLIPTGLTPIMV